MNIKKNDHLHETFSRIAGNTRGKVMTDQEESVHLLKENMQECIPFQGLGDMMMKMDRIYDLLDYPQTSLKSGNGMILKNGQVRRWRTMMTGIMEPMQRKNFVS